MKIEKNKIVFASVILCVVLFISFYATILMGGDETPEIENNQIPIPEFEDNQKSYNSKLDAINDLKEVRQSNAPSIYDERLLDSTGVYDPNLLEKEKMRIVDSIYNDIRFINAIDDEGDYYFEKESIVESKPSGNKEKTWDVTLEKENQIESQELALNHQLFFASNPLQPEKQPGLKTDNHIYVSVNGTQTVKTHYRLQMRLLQDAFINNILVPKNSLVYGFISFKPNRAMIEIEHVNHDPVKLKAYDLQDGSEGIYVENSFRAEASQEVIDDVVQDVNIAGVPQVSGIKKIFQRNNRTIKVTIANNYKLILKAH